MSQAIQYRKRRKYKYVLAETYRVWARLAIARPDPHGLLSITHSGYLTIWTGYAWDGPTRPAIDTRNFMRGSLVHDALYQLMREGVIAQDQRQAADEILRRMCLEDGMSRVRAWWVYHAVRKFGAKSARPDILTAP